MADKKIWLLKLVLPGRYGKLLTGILLFSVLYPVFSLGVLADSDNASPALFYSLIIAYIIPIFGYITEKSQEALHELRTLLHLNGGIFSHAQARLNCVNVRAIVIQISTGILCGFTHMSFVRGSASSAIKYMSSSLTAFTSTLGAIFVWVIMTTVVYMLIQQAVLFARLGRGSFSFSLLRTRSLLPFARVSINSSLAIIGALALFPLISIENGLNSVEILPGAVATMAPLIAMFIIPVWPIHCRMTAMKEQQMANIDDKIDTYLDAAGDTIGSLETGALERLVNLLNYRREISSASTWPFDGSNVSRLALYLIIPPLTWVAAALIEKLVDSLF